MCSELSDKQSARFISGTSERIDRSIKIKQTLFKLIEILSIIFLLGIEFQIYSSKLDNEYIIHTIQM